MKKNGFIILGICFAIIAGATVFLSSKPAEQNNQVVLAATVFPIYDIARNIAGGNADVKLIVPPGTSPHSFDISAQTVKNLQDADIVFHIGYGVDDWIASFQQAMPNIPVVGMDKGIILREAVRGEHEDEGERGDEENHEEEEEDDHGHGAVDPHYWLDPDNAKIMARTIADELIRLDPSHAEAYTERKDQFIATLEAQDILWKHQLSGFTKRDILTFHDAFYYFAEHFDLNVVATYEPFVGKEPTPQYLAELHKEVKEHDIRVLFIEPQLSRSGLDAFAADVGAAVGVLDEMGGKDGKESYIDLIAANVREVEQALTASR